MSYYFISDLHLANNRPQLIKLFEKFFVLCEHDAEEIYILGDLFDRWIGDDEKNKFNQHIIQLLKQQTDKGRRIYIMRGNRDFLIGKAFAKASGCILLRDPSFIAINGKLTLLKHGDDMCLADKRHQYFRRFSQSPAIKKLFLRLPLHWRLNIVKKLQSQSRSLDKSKLYLTDIHHPLIPEIMQKFNLQQVIHGHTHRPSIHLLWQDGQWKQHMVLSDWGKKANYLRIYPDGEENIAELCYFD